MTSSFKGLIVDDTGYLNLPTGTSANRPSLQSNTAIQWTNTGSQAYSVLAGSAGTVSNTSWTCPTGVTSIEVLVVGGGGSAGSRHPGGGGAGGLLYNSAFPVVPGTAYSVTVGTGGAGVILTSNINGNNGTSSVFGTLTAVGGGAGGTYLINGFSGGSGGGGGEGGTTIGGAGTTGQGHPGGGQRNAVATYGGAGGGGGAGGPGTDGGVWAVNGVGRPGAGGPGLAFAISGTMTYYAGGGGGAAYNSLGNSLGGQGGGGNGVLASATPPSGTASTGGGGGGNATGTTLSYYSGSGGSGTVIIRYTLADATSQPYGQTRFNTVTGVTETIDHNNIWTSQPISRSTVSNGLVLHLDADRQTASSTTWTDLSGRGNNGTLTNGAAFTPSTYGRQLFTTSAASFDDGANNTTGWAVGYGSGAISSVGVENGITPYYGTYQLKLTGASNGDRLDYAFTVVAGRSYEVTFYANKFQGQYYFINYIATSNSSDNLGSAINTEGAVDSNPSAWTLTTLRFTAATTGTYYLSFRMATGSSPSVITYVDAVSIREIINAYGNSVYFDGTDDYVALPNGLLQGTGDFTVTAWAQSTVSRAGQTIFGSYSSSNLQVGVGTTTAFYYLANGSAYASIRNDEFSITTPTQLTVLRRNTVLETYINNSLRKTGSSSDTVGGAGTVFRIGMNTGGGERFQGNIYAIQVYDRCLSQAELAQNYAAYSPRFNRDGGQPQLAGWNPNAGYLAANGLVWYSERGTITGYSSAIWNQVFEGDFTLVASWQHDYIGFGMVYGPSVSTLGFTGYSSDAVGPYFGALVTSGFSNGYSASFLGQYHAPINGGGGNTSNQLYYFKWQRSGNLITLQYSLSGPTGPWTDIDVSPRTTISSADKVICGIGEASSTEIHPLTFISLTYS